MLIAKLTKVPFAVRAALAADGIFTTSGLWRSIGTDFAAGLPTVASETGRSEEEVASVLAAELLHKPALWWLVVRDAVVAVSVLWLAGFLIARVSESPAPKQYVVAKESLPALHLLAAGELDLAATDEGGLDAIADAEDRRLLRPVAEGEALTESHLTPAGVEPGDLEGLVLLEVPLEGEPGEIEASIGSRVQLLFSPKVLAGQGGLKVEALVLALDSSGDENVTMVAVAPGEVSPIARFLATSEISIARKCCPATAGVEDENKWEASR